MDQFVWDQDKMNEYMDTDLMNYDRIKKKERLKHFFNNEVQNEKFSFRRR